MNQCPNCKEPADADAKFCIYCNADLSQAQQSIPVSTSEPRMHRFVQTLSASQRIDEQIKAVNGDYLVIPFIGKIKSGFFSSENAETVSRQLQFLINQYSQQGWEFHNIAKVDIEVTPGCLASLFGAKASYITFDQVIFRRARP